MENVIHELLKEFSYTLLLYIFIIIVFVIVYNMDPFHTMSTILNNLDRNNSEFFSEFNLCLILYYLIMFIIILPIILIFILQVKRIK
jgi:hypothetical protein